MAKRPIRTGGTDWRYARVGLVLLVGLVITAYITYRVGDIFDLWTPSYEVLALFPRVTGLSTDAAVTIAGRRVGKVTGLELIPPEHRVGDAHVLVRLSLSTAIQQQVRSDSRARLRLQGLLGDRFVDIEPGSPAARPLEPGDTLLTVPPIELEEHILEPLAVIMGDASLAVAGLRDVTDRLAAGEGTLGRLLVDDALYIQASAVTAELEGVLRDIRQSEGTLNRLIHDPALYDDLQRALARVDELGRDIMEAEGTLGLLLHDDLLYQRMLAFVDRADTAAVALSRFAQGLAEGDGTLHRLLEDPELYDQLLRAVVDIQHLILQIRTDPRQIRPEFHLRLFR